MFRLSSSSTAGLWLSLLRKNTRITLWTWLWTILMDHRCSSSDPSLSVSRFFLTDSLCLCRRAPPRPILTHPRGGHRVSTTTSRTRAPKSTSPSASASSSSADPGTAHRGLIRCKKNVLHLNPTTITRLIRAIKNLRREKVIPASDSSVWACVSVWGGMLLLPRCDAVLSASALPFDVMAHLNKSGGGDSPAHTLNKALRCSSTVVSSQAVFLSRLRGKKIQMHGTK